MIDEDAAQAETGVVDLAMRGWRTLDEHPLDPAAVRVQLEHNNLQTLPKSIGDLTFMAHLDVSTGPPRPTPRSSRGAVAPAPRGGRADAVEGSRRRRGGVAATPRRGRVDAAEDHRPVRCRFVVGPRF